MSRVRRTEMLNFRVTPEEKAEIKLRAVGMDLSKYLRLKALGQPVAHSETTPEERAVLSTRNVQVNEQGSVEVTPLTRRVNQLIASGTSQQRAEHQARRELGL